MKLLKKLFYDKKIQEENLDFEKLQINARRIQKKKKNEEIRRNERVLGKKALLSALSKITDPREYIVNYLLIHYNVRNLDLMLNIVKSTIQAKNTDVNYLVVRKNDIVYIRNVYKTERSYGKKKHIINSKKFRNMVLEFMKDKETPVPLLANKAGELIEDRQHISVLVKKLSIGQLGEALIFKGIVKSIDKHGNLNQLKKASNNRGTSIETIINEYHINLDKYD